MKKAFWIISITLVVLLVAAAIVAGLFIGTIAKKGIETVGPKITQVPVTVDGVDLAIFTGSVKIKTLVVGNPEGYKTPEAIRVGTVAVSVNPFSLVSDKIIVHTIKLESPEITFEGNLGANNLSKILDNVNGVSNNGGPTPTNSAAATTSAGANKPQRKLQVDDFLITGGKIHINFTGFGGKVMTVPLPDIHLTDLGKGPDGITATDLTRQVMNAITSDTIKAVGNVAANLGKGMENLGKQSVNSLKTKFGGLFGK